MCELHIKMFRFEIMNFIENVGGGSPLARKKPAKGSAKGPGTGPVAGDPFLFFGGGGGGVGWGKTFFGCLVFGERGRRGRN